MNAAGDLSRRRFLRGAGQGSLVLGAGLLGACATPGLTPEPRGTGVVDVSRAQRVVSFANWPNYVDSLPGNRHVHPTLREFTRRTGIIVDYSEPIHGNDQFTGQIGVRLALGEDPGYDLAVLTDWSVAELIGRGWIQPLSAAAVPNAARLVPAFRNHPLPDVRRYSLPWQGGFTGIGWNSAVTRRPVTGMSDLLTAPDLHGRVGIVAEMRDVMGLIMLDMGTNPASFTGAEFDGALAMLDRAVRSGQILTVTNDYSARLDKGQIAACTAWAGDVISLNQTNPLVQFALPAAGGMLWTDNMVIPAFAHHKENAENLMNFYYQPGPAAQLSAYELFICPVLGAQASVRQVDPALADQQYVFPSPVTLAQAHYFMQLPPTLAATYNTRFATVVGF
jgi:spermidine/putrescine transport system substrate-binding protein